MSEMGVNVAGDKVYPDLVFSLRNPPVSGPTGTVGVGLMTYFGSNDDRDNANQLHQHYVDTMTRFVHWLLNGGRKVRLYATDQEDQPTVRAVLADVRAQRMDNPDIEVEAVSTLQELMRRMATVDTVVGSRYHNVVCALKLSKPTVSVGYAAKHEVLMRDMDMGDFCEPARSVDLDRLIAKFGALERDRDTFIAILDEHNLEKIRLLDEQFAALSSVVAAPSHGPGAALTATLPFEEPVSP